jgi:hypothetical protein
MNKDKDLIERMNRNMSAQSKCKFTEDEIRDMNRNERMKDVKRLIENYEESHRTPFTLKNVSYSRPINKTEYLVGTDTSDGKDYTAKYVYKFPSNDRDNFRLLYAKVNEVRLRMEKILASNDDVDYAYEVKKYKDWVKKLGE